MEPCKLTFKGWADPLLGHPNRFSLVQDGLDPLGIHDVYVFRALLPVFCEYFTLDLRFLTNLSPSLTPFILSFSFHTYHFLGRLYVEYIPLELLLNWLSNW